MQDIGCNRPIYVNIRELLPKRVYNGLDTCIGTSLKKAAGVDIKGIECFQDAIQVTEPWCWVITVVLSELIAGYGAGRTFTSFGTRC